MTYSLLRRSRFDAAEHVQGIFKRGREYLIPAVKMCRLKLGEE